MSEILNKHGFSFQKKYGQNFLQDVKIPRRIAAECSEYERISDQKIRALILEIGPGAGILTKELAAIFEKVTAVEIDTSLEPVLKETLAQSDNTEVIFGDVMETDLEKLLEEKRLTKENEKLPVSVCANLPYYITTPILMKLVEEYDDFDYITVMVQKEVASRLTSAAGSAQYGSITAALNLYGSVKRLFTVPSGCFYPRPKVDSAVIRIALHKPAKYTKEEIYAASKVIKAAFSVRRKTLVNGLVGICDLDKSELNKIVENLFGDANIRGETLSAEQFVILAKALGIKADKRTDFE